VPSLAFGISTVQVIIHFINIFLEGSYAHLSTANAAQFGFDFAM
jgi:hypothetical protein